MISFAVELVDFLCPFRELQSSVSNTLPLPCCQFTRASDAYGTIHSLLRRSVFDCRWRSAVSKLSWVESHSWRPFGDDLQYDLLGEPLVHFLWGKFPCFKTCLVSGGMNRSSVVADEMAAVFWHVYMPEAAISHVPEFHENFQKDLSALLKFVW